jgi:hypothetical protein
MYLQAMRGHMFYMITTGVAAISMHVVLLKALEKWKWLGEHVPPLFNFPQFEIKLFIGFSMGMLDVALAVLATIACAPGWKVGKQNIESSFVCRCYFSFCFVFCF